MLLRGEVARMLVGLLQQPGQLRDEQRIGRERALLRRERAAPRADQAEPKRLLLNVRSLEREPERLDRAQIACERERELTEKLLGREPANARDRAREQLQILRHHGGTIAADAEVLKQNPEPCGELLRRLRADPELRRARL